MYAYETLYCSSVAFGMRKALQAQEGKEKLQDMVCELEAERKRLENQISDMKIKADQALRRNAELRASEEKKHAEEIVFLKKTSAQLKVGVNTDLLNDSMFKTFHFRHNWKASLPPRNKLFRIFNCVSGKPPSGQIPLPVSSSPPHR